MKVLLKELWSILNSPFSIFLLGSVVLLLITKYWEHVQKKREIESANRMYMMEACHRIRLILRSLPLDAEITNIELPRLAIIGGRQCFKPLFQQFMDQAFDGILAYLSLCYPDKEELFNDVSKTVDDVLHFVSQPINRDRREMDTGGGSSRVWYVYNLSSEQCSLLAKLRDRLEAHYKSLKNLT